jgi:hypothetical protein
VLGRCQFSFKTLDGSPEILVQHGDKTSPAGAENSRRELRQSLSDDAGGDWFSLHLRNKATGVRRKPEVALGKVMRLGRVASKMTIRFRRQTTKEEPECG